MVVLKGAIDDVMGDLAQWLSGLTEFSQAFQCQIPQLSGPLPSDAQSQQRWISGLTPCFVAADILAEQFLIANDVEDIISHLKSETNERAKFSQPSPQERITPGQINPGQAYLGESDNSYVLSEEEPVQFTKFYKIGHTLGRSLGRLAGYITINKT